MVSSRVATAVLGLVLSIVVSVVVYVYTESLFLFLFVPFVPFLFRGLGGDEGADDRRPTVGGPSDERTVAGEEHSAGVRECPNCGFRTTDEEYTYCPRDGTTLR